MNRETGAWIAVALLSISALGVSATTLDSTVATDPNDVIELDYDTVPIGTDTASNLVDEIEAQQRNGEPSRAATAAAGDPSQSQSQPADSGSEASSGGDPQGKQEAGGQQRQRSQDQSGSPTTETPSLLDRLLALLTALMPFLLAIAGVLTAAAVAIRYRERLAALFARPDPDDDAEPAAPVEAAPAGDSPPANTVERAWLRMVRRLDLDGARTMTTSECASAAIAAGLERDAVETLTETYEEVRYGGRPVTQQREQRAQRSERRLDGGGGA